MKWASLMNVMWVLCLLLLGFGFSSLLGCGKTSSEADKPLPAAASTDNTGQEEQDPFLAQNKNEPGVVTTASGLQYLVLRKGDGPKPKASDLVKVDYRGTLVDGTEFDSSYKRGKPATFRLNRVIAGWTEALQLMKVGSKYRLFIPSELAYGQRGSGPQIGPNATLIFEVELLAILK